ncbi:cold shock domain-containing protein C2-like [Asterias amurensis]|uniref:cold shock domain-containing protein C2-like n=1 Tax=Asterias amurensis TaxID=7602 RepID=UPI003AB2E999
MAAEGTQVESGGDCEKRQGSLPMFLIPSPIITRRTRTESMTSLAAQGANKHGIIVDFSKSKGHGFIRPDVEGSTDNIFLHISDIDGDYVPQPGDKVIYKEHPLPPQNVQLQAVHVKIVQMDRHHDHPRWEDPEAHSQSH